MLGEATALLNLTAWLVAIRQNESPTPPTVLTDYTRSAVAIQLYTAPAAAGWSCAGIGRGSP